MSSDHFQDIAHLGSGGFGQVFKVRRIRDGEILARKVLIDDSPEAVSRFQKEVRLLARLDHPRIVKIVGTSLNESPPSYVMPLYPRSLREELPSLLDREDRIVRVFEAVLQGVEYAHEQGVVHET